MSNRCESFPSRHEWRLPAPTRPRQVCATDGTPVFARFFARFRAGVSVHRSVVPQVRQNQACFLCSTSPLKDANDTILTLRKFFLVCGCFRLIFCSRLKQSRNLQTG